jgi:hypothetical protein
VKNQTNGRKCPKTGQFLRSVQNLNTALFLLVAAGSFFTYNKKQILKKGVLRMAVCFTAEAAGEAVG